MSVSREVVHEGRTVLGKGTKIEARIKGVICQEEPYANCFVILKTETYADASRSGPFSAGWRRPAWKPSSRKAGKAFA